MFVGKRDKSQTVFDAQLSEYGSKVVPYCGLGDAQLLRDLFVSKTATNQGDKLLLSAGKLPYMMFGIRAKRR